MHLLVSVHAVVFIDALRSSWILRLYAHAVIFMDDDGMLNVTGGKWTTYRSMAEQVGATGRLPLVDVPGCCRRVPLVSCCLMGLLSVVTGGCHCSVAVCWGYCQSSQVGATGQLLSAGAAASRHRWVPLVSCQFIQLVLPV